MSFDLDFKGRLLFRPLVELGEGRDVELRWCWKNRSVMEDLACNIHEYESHPLKREILAIFWVKKKCKVYHEESKY